MKGRTLHAAHRTRPVSQRENETLQTHEVTPPSNERIGLTCLDRYWLRSLWFLSTCLDMVPSDDRLNSKFSIVSFVASG